LAQRSLLLPSLWSPRQSHRRGCPTSRHRCLLHLGPRSPHRWLLRLLRQKRLRKKRSQLKRPRRKKHKKKEEEEEQKKEEKKQAKRKAKREAEEGGKRRRRRNSSWKEFGQLHGGLVS